MSRHHTTALTPQPTRSLQVVIQRPASVVRVIRKCHFLSFHRIRLIIKDAGKTLIQH
ncbi:MAG: hypothetical protein IPO25_23255 [Saprospiraceae bacterium]|nr:hypothetical protein [Saprospiraceae bacterium]